MTDAYSHNIPTDAVEILPNMWLGNISAALNIDFLKSNKITCIINCTDTCPFVEYDIKKIRIPIKDNGTEEEIFKMYTVLDKATTLIYELLHKYPILIHCYAGRQRSVSVVLAFLMKYARFTLQEAIDALRKKKPKIGINFSHALVRYQLDLMHPIF